MEFISTSLPQYDINFPFQQLNFFQTYPLLFSRVHYLFSCGALEFLDTRKDIDLNHT
jgi:hypothetical protein